MGSPETVIHASTVAISDHAVLITGPSGSGKSALALQLMAMGAALIADDQTKVKEIAGVLWASKPESLPAKIEARGIGLLDATIAKPCRVVLLIDLAKTETRRYPEARSQKVLGQMITAWQKVDGPHFPAAISHYLMHKLHLSLETQA